MTATRATPSLDTMNECRVSVVICTRNRGDKVVAALASIFKCDTSDTEVILIDQSTDGETKIAIEPFVKNPRFHYVASQQVGTGRARNMGLRESRGEFVLYTDDDCAVSSNWIEEMTRCFERDPRIAVVFCNVVPAEHDDSKGFIPTYIRDEDRAVTSLWQKCRARGIGAGMGVRRAAALEIGGFDSCLGPGTNFPDCEDGDMAVRALLKHWKVYETAKTEVVHDGFRTWKEGKQLTQRNWVGIGAAYAKPIRCREWRFMSVVLYEAFVIAALKPLRETAKLRGPRGARSVFYFWKGFFSGWRYPLDPRTLKFVDQTESVASGSSDH